MKDVKTVKQQPAKAASANTLKLALAWVDEVREQANKPTTPNKAAIGKAQESFSFLTITANKIRLNECTRATTGETKETEPDAKAW
jgi:hypothetical protein